MKRRWSISIVFALAVLPFSPRAQMVGAHPIHDAALRGAGGEVAAILAATPSARDARTDLGSTPLHLAAGSPDVSALKILVAAGANPNARDSEGNTPLHIAAFAQKAENARLLLEAGADPSIRTHAGRDATSMARKAMAHDVAGVISLWVLKGCKAGKPC